MKVCFFSAGFGNAVGIPCTEITAHPASTANKHSKQAHQQAGGMQQAGGRVGGRRRVVSGRTGESACLDGPQEIHLLDKTSISLGNFIFPNLQNYAPIQQFKI